jgi:hypothetical protein
MPGLATERAALLNIVGGTMWLGVAAADLCAGRGARGCRGVVRLCDCRLTRPVGVSAPKSFNAAASSGSNRACKPASAL